MIIIRNIKLKNDDENELKKKIAKMIGMKNFDYEIYRKSMRERGFCSIIKLSLMSTCLIKRSNQSRIVRNILKKILD